MKFSSTHVVVDADVARSAGLTEHPVSKSARDLLRGISQANLHVAFCPLLLAEWRQHKSLLSARWLNSMIARKKFHLLTPKLLAKTEIDNAGLSAPHQVIAEKDAHVVDIAVATGNFITSNDKIARGVFTDVAKKSAVFDNLIWAVPTESSDALVELFSKGGLVPEEWLVRSV